MTDPEKHPATLAAQALGLDRPGDRRPGPAAPPRHHLPARSRQPVPPRPQLRPRRQPDRRPAARRCSPRWKAARRRCCSPPAWRRRRRSSGAPPPGDHVVAPQGHVLGPAPLARRRPRRWGLAVDFVDMTDLAALAAGDAARAHPAGLDRDAREPAWAVTDIAAAAAIAHAAGARLAVDNTAATPVLTRPLALGADLVMHSATKYLNGHSDVLAGALVDRARRRVLAAPGSRLRARSGGAILGSRSRPGCCCAACARSTCGSSAPAARRSASPSTSRRTRTSPRCSIRACPTIPATRSPRAR